MHVTDIPLIGVYLRRNIFLQFLFGIASGLPLALSASTLTYWLSEAGVSKASIGIFALVAIPYSIKFLWAPILDGIKLPLFGKRLGWLWATHLALVLSIALMAFSNPAETPLFTALCALLVAFCSATHDIAKDAYRVEILTPQEQGAGVAAFVTGYRMGMIVSTAGALFLATYSGWQMTYLWMAGVMAVLMLPMFFAKEPAEYKDKAVLPKGVGHWLSHYVVTPFGEFIKRPEAWWILSFVLLYRMTDAFMGIMAGPFYLELGFTKPQIGEVAKLFGTIVTLVGGMIGGSIVFRLGIYKALWVGGILAALSNLMFVWQAYVGAEPYALMLTITSDNLSAGIATVAFLAYMGVLCNREFTATQFALLTSLSAVGRSWLASPSGLAAETMGWPGFFILSTLIGIPALLILWRLKDQVLRATALQAAATSK